MLPPRTRRIGQRSTAICLVRFASSLAIKRESASERTAPFRVAKASKRMLPERSWGQSRALGPHPPLLQQPLNPAEGYVVQAAKTQELPHNFSRPAADEHPPE